MTPTSAALSTFCRRALAACGLVLVLSLPMPHRANAEDRSLAPADYVALGMPANDRLWSATDYQSALRVIAKLPREQLPRVASERSAPVLERVTDRANLGLYLNRSLPLAQRLPDLLDLIDAANAMNKIYLAALVKDLSFADDSLRLSGFMIEGAAAETMLLDEFLPTLDKSDPSYAVRMQGLDQMRRGLAQMVQGDILLLGVQDTFSSAARARFAGIAAAQLPIIAPQLPALSRQEFQAKLQAIVANERDPEVKRLLQDVNLR